MDMLRAFDPGNWNMAGVCGAFKEKKYHGRATFLITENVSASPTTDADIDFWG